jgi:hypothetical protein
MSARTVLVSRTSSSGEYACCVVSRIRVAPDPKGEKTCSRQYGSYINMDRTDSFLNVICSLLSQENHTEFTPELIIANNNLNLNITSQISTQADKQVILSTTKSFALSPKFILFKRFKRSTESIRYTPT